MYGCCWHSVNIFLFASEVPTSEDRATDEGMMENDDPQQQTFKMLTQKCF